MKKFLIAAALVVSSVGAVTTAADAAGPRCNRSGCHFDIRPW